MPTTAIKKTDTVMLHEVIDRLQGYEDVQRRTAEKAQRELDDANSAAAVLREVRERIETQLVRSTLPPEQRID